MNACRTLAFAALFAGITSAASADLRITEVMVDPSGTDADREWIEIYNPGTQVVDLSNYKVGDEETAPTSTPGDEGMYSFPAGAILQPGQVAVVTQKINGTSSFRSLYAGKGTAFLDSLTLFEISDTDGVSGNNMTKYTTWATGDLALSNSSYDQIVLVDPNDTIIDKTQYQYTGTTHYAGWPTVGSNQSFERVPADVDTGSGADWIVRSSGQATPGEVTLSPEPASLSLLGFGILGLASRRRRA